MYMHSTKELSRSKLSKITALDTDRHRHTDVIIMMSVHSRRGPYSVILAP